jgi:PAS domain S-box-containing protein
MLLRRAVDPVLAGATYLTAYPAIMISAWYGGIGPGLLCTLLCGIATLYLFVTPRFSFSAAALSDLVTFTGFLLVGSALSALIHAVTRARTDAEQQRRWLRQTLSGIGDAVIATDNGGHIEFMNPVAERLTGWSLADAAGRHVREVFNIRREGTNEPVPNPVERVLTEGTVVGLANHTELHARGGAVYPIDDSGAPIRDESGDMIGVVLVFRDVGVRRRAEKAVETARARVTAILESIADGFIAVDAGWRITYANAPASRKLRIPQNELVGLQLHEVFPGAAGAPGAPELERAMRDRATVQFEVHLPLRDSWFDLSAYPTEDGLSLFFRDITRRKQAEAEVAHAHAQLDAFFEHAPIGMGLWDRELRFVRVNNALAQINGLPVEAHIGRTISEVLPGVGSEAAETFRHVFATGEPLVGKEVSGWTAAPSETRRYWAVSCYPIRVDGEIRFISAVVEEITGRKKAEHELQALTHELHRANQDLRLFAYAASHDLQEPLRMVTNYLGLLERRYRDQLDQDAHDFIDYAVAGARRMEGLLNDLRHYWSAVSQSEAPPASVSVERSLSAALGNLAAAIEQSGAVVTHGALPVVVADETPLVQLLQNLIGNAIKYRREETPAIHISAERDGAGYWQIAVRDNGMGIPAEYLHDIFQPFKRLHGRETPGTGIGLALAQKIVERYGGRIWVDSEPGSGSTFRFTLPSADDKA